MVNFLIVGLGGFVGAVSRYGTGQIFAKILPVVTAGSFPISTFFVNGVGSFIIGMMASVFAKNGGMGSFMQLFIMVGILGGFTTFSSFSLETVNLILQNKWGVASIYIVASMVVCLVGVYFGKCLGNTFI